MKRFISALILLLILCSVLVSLAKVQTVKASGTIYIRADGSVDPPTVTIQRNGDLYIFTSGITDSIVVERDNIVVDGASYTVQGPGSGTGIYLFGRSNVTIKNMIIKAFGYGIYLHESSNSGIYENNITNNDYGVKLLDSSYNIISGNSVTNNINGVWLYFSHHNNISGNNITANSNRGVWLEYNSNFNSIYRNNITNHNSDGIKLYLDSNYNSIVGNNIANNNHGTVISESSDNSIYHNNFVNNDYQANNYNSANDWNDGNEGNYWSNYIGVDLTLDGIGDSPYVIDATNTDNHPLMGLFHSFSTSFGYYVNIISNSTIEGFAFFEFNSTIKIHISPEFPLSISEHTRRLYNFTEALPTGSIVIESFDFGPSTILENMPQAKAHIFHAKQRGLKIVALAFWPSGTPVGESILKDVYGSAFPNIPEYGTSVVFLGYVPGNEVGMQTFGDNTWNAKGTDHYGTAVGGIPLMQQCRSAADFDLWAEWTSGDPGITQVIQFVQGRQGGPSAVPVVTGATAVSVPGIMPYYSAGQIVGILKGLSGAREYDYLLNVAYGYPNVTASQTFRFCRLTIPHDLLHPPYNVTVNDDSVPYTTILEDETLSIIYFSYEPSTVEVMIIPEFLPLTILPLFMIATVLAATIYKRKFPRNSNHY